MGFEPTTFDLATVEGAKPVVSPFGVAITPNGKRAYVVCDDGVVVLETSTIVATVPMPGLSAGGEDSIGIAITPNGERAYIASHVIDIATNRVVGTFPGMDNGIAITPDGERAYIATDEVPGVAVLDINTNEIVAGIETEDTIKGIVIAPVDKRAYATDRSGVVGCSIPLRMRW